MIDYTQGAGIQYHIGVAQKDVGEYVFLTGDPGRVESIASRLENSCQVGAHREYITWTGWLDKTRVSVMSTGIGGPSMAIGIEELVRCGAHTFLRLGSCGGMKLSVRGGDLCIANGAIRAEGTSREYAPVEFPAVPDFTVLEAQVNSARKLGITHHVGVVHCKDSFYGQHEPLKSPVGKRLEENWQSYCALDTICSEMESSTLFIVSQALHVRAGAMFIAFANQEREKQGLDNTQNHDLKPMLDCAIDTMRTLIQNDKKRENHFSRKD